LPGSDRTPAVLNLIPTHYLSNFRFREELDFITLLLEMLSKKGAISIGSLGHGYQRMLIFGNTPPFESDPLSENTNNK